MIQNEIYSPPILPDSFLGWHPGKFTTLKEAFFYCEQLAKSHYENFTVGSFLIPKIKRQHIYNVYAFCRWADDLGDETGSPEKATQLLKWWGDELESCYKGNTSHPVFTALYETIKQFDIPIQPFKDLIFAFTLDQTKTRHETFEELCEYAGYSANPVGRIYLQLFGYTEKKLLEMSDATCTALQLTNFWQDVTLDLEKGRIYIPQTELKQAGYTEEDLSLKRFTPSFRNMMLSLVKRTRTLFQQGMPLLEYVAKPVKLDIELFSRGGIAILDAIEAQNYDVLSRRPKLGKLAKLKLLTSRVIGI